MCLLYSRGWQPFPRRWIGRRGSTMASATPLSHSMGFRFVRFG